MAKPERAHQRGVPEVADSALGWRFVNPRLAALHPPIAMGETAENLVEKYDISREAQDAFALRSHERALASREAGELDAEIVPVAVPAGRGESALFEHDEGPRADTSLDRLARLRPVFREGGTVTAGNSSALNDGAAAVLLASESACERHGLEPVARVVASGVVGVDPSIMGIGPVEATHKALARAGWTLEDVDTTELNEAFAGQVLAVLRELPLDEATVNPQGGAIALGHPLGSTGARLTTTLVHRLRREPTLRRGLVTLCVGVGQGEFAVGEGLEAFLRNVMAGEGGKRIVELANAPGVEVLAYREGGHDHNHGHDHGHGHSHDSEDHDHAYHDRRVLRRSQEQGENGRATDSRRSSALLVRGRNHRPHERSALHT
jgi:acetyl-CoA acetyltransferase family protein